MNLQQLADDVAAGYARTENVAAVVIAGSVGRGRSDEHSDIEVDVYWAEPPSDEQRRAGIDAVSGQDATIWEYDEDDEEYSDDFILNGVPVGISGFTVGTVDGILGRQAEFRIVDQMRLSAIATGTPRVGHELVAGWRGRIVYGDAMRSAAIEHYLASVPAKRWRQLDALLAREDWLAVRQLCDQTLEACVGLWFALNRRHVEHPRLKWAGRVVPTFDIIPEGGPERLREALRQRLPDGALTARDLALDTLALVASAVEGTQAEAYRRSMLSPR